MKTMGVIFDMDGVLVDSYASHLKSWQQAVGKYGLKMGEADFARTFGRTSREIIRHLWPDFPTAKIEELDEAKEEAYREILRTAFPEMRGAGKLIGTLHQAGFKLAIGSSGPPANVELARHKLHNGNLISATVTGKEVQHGKPEPEVFLIAASKLGLEPKYCAVIEDAPVGIEAARRAGMTAIGLTGTAPRDSLTPRAHRVVDSLDELAPPEIAQLIRQNSAQ